MGGQIARVPRYALREYPIRAWLDINSAPTNCGPQWRTPWLPKCPKMAVTEIGHVIEHFHGCQNVPFIFSLQNWDILASATFT